MIATTIEQSKHLLELGLNPKTADMTYVQDLLAGLKYGDYKLHAGDWRGCYGQGHVRAWSLSAMLELMPKFIQKNRISADFNIRAHGQLWNVGYYCIEVKFSEDIIEAAYSLLCWLIENNFIKTEKQC